MVGFKDAKLNSQQYSEARLIYWITATGSTTVQLQCLTYFSGYLIGLLGTIASEKPLYTAGPHRPNLNPYVQSTFIEMQVL